MLAIRNFFRNEKVLFRAKVIHFEISKIHTITLHARTSIAIPQKSSSTVFEIPTWNLVVMF